MLTTFLIIGFLAGLPVGIFGTMLLRRTHPKQCVASLEDGQRCRGHKANVCIDNLCPRHCKSIHQDACFKNNVLI